MNTDRKRQIFGDENISRAKTRKIDFLPEQNLLKFVSVPSLESMAIIKIATGLCKQPDIRDAIRKHSLEFDPVDDEQIRDTSYYESFDQVENNILKNLSLVSLPNLLEKKVSNVIRAIEYQIYAWIRFRKEIDFMDSIYWSNEGTIDMAKSFEQFINKDSTHNSKKENFEMACVFCMGDYIPDLFNQLPKEEKINFLCSRERCKTFKSLLITYWLRNSITKDFDGILMNTIKRRGPTWSWYQNMVTLAISAGNILAVKYFWKKLTAGEISNHLVQWVNKSFRRRSKSYQKYPKFNKHSNVIYFLLSQMNDVKQQREIFQKNSDVLLNSFLDWPWLRFLLPTLQVVWPFVGEDTYIKIFLRIAREVISSKTTENLLTDLWLDTPINLKKCFIQYLIEIPSHTNVLRMLLSMDDLHTVKLILNYANIEEKRVIMFSLIDDFFFDLLLIDDFRTKIGYVNILFKETLLTESDVCLLKKRIVLKCGHSLCFEWILDDNWQMMELFFDWASYSNEQRTEFRNEKLDKFEMLYSILTFHCDFELADKFLNWCMNNAQEISQFKKVFAKSRSKIVTIGVNGWNVFEKFIGWCFSSDEEIEEFRSHVIQSLELSGIICMLLSFVVRINSFEIVDKLIVWFYRSNEEVSQYKEMFVLSQTWMDILKRFVSSYKVYESEYSNWEIIQKLIKLFSPLDTEVVIKLKKQIEKCINFEDFCPDFRNRSFPIRQEDLFCFIDKVNFSIVNVNSNSTALITDFDDNTD